MLNKLKELLGLRDCEVNEEEYVWHYQASGPHLVFRCAECGSPDVRKPRLLNSTWQCRNDCCPMSESYNHSLEKLEKYTLSEYRRKFGC